LGSLGLILAFGGLVWRGFWLARRVSDDFGKSLIIGFSSIIAIQAMVNIGAISGFFPLTGVPLPFISYGGTALAVFLTMGGIIVNISRYRR
jgi:cell division protein FtsW